MPENDIEVCKRMLTWQKQYHKNNIKRKYMAESIFRIEGGTLSHTTNIGYNLKTSKISIFTSFIYKGRPITARKRNIRKCNNEGGKKFLEKYRKVCRELNRKRRAKISIQKEHNEQKTIKKTLS